MWSHDDETGALVEDSSTQEQLLEDGGQDASDAHVGHEIMQTVAAKSPGSEMVVGLADSQGRNAQHNFAATVGATLGAGNLLTMAPRREETAA